MYTTNESSAKQINLILCTEIPVILQIKCEILNAVSKSDCVFVTVESVRIF